MDDLLKKLHNDPLFKRALEMASSEEERKKIRAVTEAFVTQVANSVMSSLAGASRSDVLKAINSVSGSQTKEKR